MTPTHQLQGNMINLFHDSALKFHPNEPQPTQNPALIAETASATSVVYHRIFNNR